MSLSVRTLHLVSRSIQGSKKSEITGRQRLTLNGLADDSVLHVVQAADVLPPARVGVQGHARLQRHQVRRRRAFLPVGVLHGVFAEPFHVVT